MSRHWYDLRVFTRDGDGGNPLAVVPDAVEVGVEAMQKGAAEIGYSETVYLDWPEGAEVPRVRLFTPAAEIAFAGHPLVGTAWLLRNVSPMKAVEALEPPVGVIPCGADDDTGWIDPPPAPVAPSGDPSLALDALGLPTVSGACWNAGLGQQYLMVEACDVGDLAALAPDYDRLRETPFAGGVCVWCFTGDDTARMRFFAPGSGVDEDPATGSAAVALASVLAWGDRFPEERRLMIDQGDELGRPCRLEITSTEDGNVRLSGAVTLKGTREVSV